MEKSLESKFAALKSKGFQIDLTRGKPGSDQLDLSNEMLSAPVSSQTSSGIDIRNYGEPLGIPEYPMVRRSYGCQYRLRFVKILEH